MVFITSTADTAEVLLQMDCLGHMRMPVDTSELILDRFEVSVPRYEKPNVKALW